MVKTYLLLILFVLIASNFSAQNCDSLETLVLSSQFKTQSEVDRLIHVLNCYNQNGKIKELDVLLNKAIRVNPRSSRLYFIKGVFLDNRGFQLEAIQAYKKSISIKKDYLDANYNLGVLFYNAFIEAKKQTGSLNKSDYSNAKQARKYLEVAYLLDTSQSYLIKPLNDCYEALGRNDKLKPYKEEIEND